MPTVPPSELGFHHVGRFLQCESGQKFDQTRLRNDVDSDEPQSGNDFFSGIAEQLRGLFSGPLSPTSRTRRVGASLTTSVPVNRRSPAGSLLHFTDAVNRLRRGGYITTGFYSRSFQRLKCRCSGRIKRDLKRCYRPTFALVRDARPSNTSSPVGSCRGAWLSSCRSLLISR